MYDEGKELLQQEREKSRTQRAPRAAHTDLLYFYSETVCVAQSA